MRSQATIALAALMLAGVAGCAESEGEIDRTQTNLVDKSVFEGEFWYVRTVQDIADDGAWAIEQAGVGAPWPGAMSSFDIASRSGALGRIRWVIDEDFLYAYRVNETIIGSASNADDDDYLGQPLAAFRIEGHVDVRREYNPLTGEASNVLWESQDRRWYDRQYVRVDWSQNLISFGIFGAGLDTSDLVGGFVREPVTSFVQEGGDERTPDSWRPTFVRIGQDPDYRLRDEWPSGTEDTVHYMSFVTNELWTPTNCPGTVCQTSIRLALRHAFLRVPPNHEYAVETQPNSEYDQFGILRMENRTYVRGGLDRDSTGVYCDARCLATCTDDSECGTGGRCTFTFDPDWGEEFGRCTAGTNEDADDCGAGSVCNYGTGQCQGSMDADCGPGLCNTESNLCEGGLTPEYGETDFLSFYRMRHNLYADSLTDQACVGDWQCDGRFGGTGTRGSVCDPAAGRCTIPIAQRPVRPTWYRLSAHYPKHLVRSAFEVVSEWNEAYMRGHRELSGRTAPVGQAVQCQGTDPTAHCFCGTTIRAPEVREDNTCLPKTNFFVPPAERGETEPYDCWIGLVDANGNVVRETADVNPASPTSFDQYPNDVYRYAFTGSECLFTLKVNSCDVPGSNAQCEELGDIRHQFFNYVSGAGAGWCGVMQQVSDPTTGEAISIPINMSGLCLEYYGNTPVDYWPILRGEEPEEGYLSGEFMREYFANRGNVHVPVGLAPAIDGAEYDSPDPSRPAMPIDLAQHVNSELTRAVPRVEQLRATQEGRSHIFSGRLGNLAGSTIERRLLESVSLEGMNAVRSMNPLQAARLEEVGVRTPTDARAIEDISPFRTGFDEMLTAERRREMLMSENYVCNAHEGFFTSRYNQYWAEAFRNFEINQAHIRWTQVWHKFVMLHEMGHGVGLEHNFAGSYDRNNYSDGYYSVVTRRDAQGRFTNALPTFEEFNCGRDGLCRGAPGYPGPDETEGDGTLTGVELTRYTQALEARRISRNQSGIAGAMASTVMDYHGAPFLYGLGHYDHAAVYYNYFNLAEAYRGDPVFREGRTTQLDGLHRPDITPRRLMTMYRGGESCQVNTDCPYARGSSALVPNQPVHQRCVRNPRYSNVAVACAGDRNCLCSNFDQDFNDYVDRSYLGYESDADEDGRVDHFPVNYMFCSNPRLSDISWCSTRDAGESFQETIDHYRQSWRDAYPRSYFRNYQRGFTSGSRATSYIIDAAKIFQHLFFRFFYEPEFRRQEGPLGVNDQYLASIDSMNWLAELAQLPDVGSYRTQLVGGPDACHPSDPRAPGNPATCRYAHVHLGNDMNMSGSTFNLGLGQGYYHWSRYQDGLYGFFRMERAGVFWDKFIAMRALTIRDWGLGFNLDERFLINYYDLLPREMTELFGGYIIDDPAWFAPRVRMQGTTPQLYYVNHLFGNCENPTTGVQTNCDRPAAERFPDPPLVGTSNEVLRLFAAIFSLAEFPFVYNPAYESNLTIFKLQNGDGFTIPNTQLDGQPTLAYGQAMPGSAHAVTNDPAEADYIIYTSDRLNFSYAATKLYEPQREVDEEEQLGFQFLLRLTNLQNRARQLQGNPARAQELAQVRAELTRSESFLESLIEVTRTFGIGSWQ